MKKLLMAAVAALAVSGIMAQEAEKGFERPTDKTSWPMWLAFNSANDPDVVGLRLTLPYGVSESITGFDVGIFGRVRYMEGVQVNLLRNDALDQLAGVQVGIYNSAGRADFCGVQVGLFNETQSICGLQAGLVNIANTVYGFQAGIVNRAETMYGFQVGIINVIRDSELPFMPIVNIGLDEYTRY